MNNLQQGCDLIRSLSQQELVNLDSLEQLICDLGLNDEFVHEQSKSLHDILGKGLEWRIWQYPNQFSKYLLWLSNHASNINNYIEIGCRYGGTFVLTVEYIKRFNPNFQSAVAVDLIERSGLLMDYDCEYLQMNSLEPTFPDWLQNKQFELALIDGDHFSPGVNVDWTNLKDRTQHIVFHDINSIIFTNPENPGVTVFWNHLKQTVANQYKFTEFCDTYSDIPAGGPFLGIGIASKINS